MTRPGAAQEDEGWEPLEELKSDKTGSGAAAIDLDEVDLADNFELPGADLCNEELLVRIVPVQTDGVHLHVLLPGPPPQPVSPGGRWKEVLLRM